MENSTEEINSASTNGENTSQIMNLEESNDDPNSARSKLRSWLNGSLKIKMTDGRVIVGNFFCTDRDSNIILGSSGEYLKEEDDGVAKPRSLGLVMVPGRHIVSIHYLSCPNDTSSSKNLNLPLDEMYK